MAAENRSSSLSLFLSPSFSSLPSSPSSLPPDWSVSIGRMSEGEGILLFSTSTRRIVDVSEAVPTSREGPGKLKVPTGSRHGARDVQRPSKRVWKQLALSADAIREYASTSPPMPLPADIILGHEERTDRHRRRRPHLRRSERARGAALKTKKVLGGEGHRAVPVHDRARRQ